MLSIIIPTFNEEKLLPRLLEDIEKQTYDNFECIVSDCQSEDNTKKIAKKFGCRVLNCKKRSPAAARNRGSEAAKGHFLLFLDADVRIPSPSFLEKLMKKVNGKGLSLLTFTFYHEDGDKMDNLVSKYMLPFVLKMANIFGSYSPGAFIFVSKEIHQKIGGFDETLFLAEDHHYSKRAKKYAKMCIIDDLKISTSNRRLKKEGKFRLYCKYLYLVFYRMLNGEIRRNLFNYEFGNHQQN